jgi:hypothetical protein
MQGVQEKSWKRAGCVAPQLHQRPEPALVQGTATPAFLYQQPTAFQLECNGLELLNVFASGGAEAGTVSVCSFDATFSLTTGVTGNYFEGPGTPSAWTSNNVEVIVINHANSNAKRKISGAVRVSGCRLNFKDKTVEPPVILASSSMQSGWKETGNQNSLVFTSHNASQTVKIVSRETEHRDDAWPYFCQVDSHSSRHILFLLICAISVLRCSVSNARRTR